MGRRARAKDKDKHHLVAALLRQRENCGGGDWAGGVAEVSDDGDAVPVPTAAGAAAAGGSERCVEVDEAGVASKNDKVDAAARGNN